MEYNTLTKGHNISRTILLIKKGLAYKRRGELENEYVASIWIQLILSKRKSILISSFYRQWSLPKELKRGDSNSIKSQLDRYKLFTNQITRASKEGKDLVVLTDENIDSFQDKCSSGYSKNIQLKNIREQNMIDNSLTYYNKKSYFLQEGGKIVHRFYNIKLSLEN